MILGLLLGNTSLRFGVFDGTEVVRSGRIEWPDLSARSGEIARVVGELQVDEAVAGSVRDDLFESLETWIPKTLLPLVVARRDFPLPIENRYERPEDAGTDRLLNAIAARARSPGQSAVAVDFGTAVSISVVGSDGAFLGGLIAAGSRAVSEGVRKLTPRLPQVDLRDIESPVGFLERSSEAALRAGIYWGVRGGVTAMLRGLRDSLGGAVKVFATGGEAALFASTLPEVDAIVNDLTLEGLAIACHARKGAA
jgi:type III pantothenate kinase